jgi:hypothetical protein
MLNRAKTAFLAASVALASAGSAVAQTASGGPDVSAMTDQVDFGTVTTAILTVGGLGIGMTLAWVAVKKIRRVVSGA